MNLPLDENGIFQIDNSFLDSFQYCPAATELLHLKKRTLKGRASAALDFGSAGHLALDARYSGASDQEQCDLLANYFAGIPESTAPDADHRDLNFAIEVFVRKYGERYPIEPFNIMLDNHGKPIVERAFSVPFAEWDTNDQTLTPWKPGQVSYPEDGLIPIHYCGRIDLPTIWDGNIVIMDHKTASRLGEAASDTYRMSAQMIGYCWAWEKITGQKPIGFCVNAIRTNSPPAKPRGGLAQWWEENYSRLKEYISDSHYEEWEDNTMTQIETFFWHYTRVKKGEALFPMNRSNCYGKYGRCQFYDLHYAPPDQRAELLRSDAYVDYTWTPFEKEKAAAAASVI